MENNNFENPNNHTQVVNSLRLISIHKVSKMLGIRYQSVKKMVITGKIKYVRIGKRVKIPYMNLVEFLEGYPDAQQPFNDNVISIEEVSKRIDELIAEYSNI